MRELKCIKIINERRIFNTNSKNVRIIVIVSNTLIKGNYKVSEFLLYCFYLYLFIKEIKFSDKDAVITEFRFT
jgi:hypothetical protein